jgi:hypothetical protein
MMALGKRAPREGRRRFDDCHRPKIELPAVFAIVSIVALGSARRVR